MEIKVIEDGKNRLVFEIPGEDTTLCNVVKAELNQDKHVKAASFKVEHPLIGVPKMMVETDGEETPRAAIAAAVKRIQKDLDNFSLKK